MKTKRLLLTVLLFFFNVFFIFAAQAFIFAAQALQQLDKWQLYYHKNPDQVFELVDANVPADFELSGTGYWNHLLEEANLQPSDGLDYGCYRCLLTGLEPGKKYAILQKDSPKTSCAVYVNRRLLAQSGDPFQILKAQEQQAKGSHSVLGPLSLEFYPDSDGKAEILFFISNYFYRKSGLNDTVYFGPAEAFTNNNYITIYSLICGAMLFIGLLCLFQFIINHQRKEYFYLGITTLALALRIATNGLCLLTIIFPNLPAEIKFKIEYSAMWVVPVCVTQMLDLLYPAKKLRAVKYAFISAELSLGLINISLPAYYSNRMISALQYTMIIVCAYVLVLSVINIFQKKRYSLYNFLSYLFVILGAFIDVLISKGSGAFSVSLLPFFLIVFFVTQVFMFARIQNDIYIETVQTSSKLQRLNEAYLRFVPREFLKLLNKESVIKTGLGDYSNIEMCIMFSKMHIYCPAGHDSLEEHFQIFDQYLKRVSPIIKTHNGFVSKFLSGGFMALFPKSELDAVLAALEINECVEDFNTTLSAKNHKLKAWMGIHFGKMIIGTIGEENRLDDTVISDTVNTSSRLEGVCEKLGKTIIISQEVMERLGAEQVLPFETSRLQDVMVKGKEKPLQIYEVVEK